MCFFVVLFRPMLNYIQFKRTKQKSKYSHLRSWNQSILTLFLKITIKHLFQLYTGDIFCCIFRHIKNKNKRGYPTHPLDKKLLETWKIKKKKWGSEEEMERCATVQQTELKEMLIYPGLERSLTGWYVWSIKHQVYVHQTSLWASHAAAAKCERLIAEASGGSCRSVVTFDHRDSSAGAGCHRGFGANPLSSLSLGSSRQDFSWSEGAALFMTWHCTFCLKERQQNRRILNKPEGLEVLDFQAISESSQLGLKETQRWLNFKSLCYCTS